MVTHSTGSLARFRRTDGSKNIGSRRIASTSGRISRLALRKIVASSARRVVDGSTPWKNLCSLPAMNGAHAALSHTALITSVYRDTLLPRNVTGVVSAYSGWKVATPVSQFTSQPASALAPLRTSVSV